MHDATECYQDKTEFWLKISRIHQIHQSRQWHNTDGISKHMFLPYNTHYLNYNFFTQFPVPVPYEYEI